MGVGAGEIVESAVPLADLWCCERARTAGEALAILRERRERIALSRSCYVTDGERLVGVASLREIALAPPETPLSDLMTANVVTVHRRTSRAEAMELLRTHGFAALPVIDDAGRLVGAVRAQDLPDGTTEPPYLQVPLVKLVRSRAVWLALLFVAEAATGSLLRFFEDDLTRVASLSLFIPLLIGVGGNAGSQTVATVIRAIARGETRSADVDRMIVREVLIGLALGAVVGAIFFSRARMWGVSVDLAACVALTMVVLCVGANTMGAAVPVVAKQLGLDPAAVSGPLILTLVSVAGPVVYLMLARLMVAKLHGG